MGKAGPTAALRRATRALAIFALAVAVALTARQAARCEDATGALLESHAVPADRREAVERWRCALPETSRSVWDERTGNLLLYAPKPTHGDLMRLLSEPGSAPRAAAAAPPATSVPRVATSSSPLRVRLTRLTPDELHDRLQGLARRPVPATWDASRTRLRFPISLRGEPAVTIDVDAREGVASVLGAPGAAGAWLEVIRVLDESLGDGGARSTLRIVAAADDSGGRVRKAVQALQVAAPSSEIRDGDEAPPGPAAAAPREAPPVDAGDVLGPVQIEFVDGLDVIVLRGDPEDVDRVTALIEQIERLSTETAPEIEVRRLRHIDSDTLARLLTSVYDRVLGPRAGDLSVTGLAKPNALLLVGRAENVRLAMSLVDQLDQPVEAEETLTAIPLKHTSAVDAKRILDEYFDAQAAQQGDAAASALRSRARVVADYRSNTLLVSAAPRDLNEVRKLLEEIDKPSGASVDEVRVFPLKNSLAEELAEVLQAALEPTESASGDASATPRSASLRLQPLGRDAVESGVLAGVRVAADTRSNALVVTAPAEGMPLLAALVEQLDNPPSAAADIKVFTITNGDAVSLAEMLRSLFGEPQDVEEGGGYGSGGIAPLNISVDERTNSIIAAGSAADLAVVEAILLRLDDSEIRERQTSVYRLKNARATDVATALNQWLQTEREAERQAELAISPFEQIEREVVIVAEDVSNSLIVSATPRYEAEVRRLVEELDERPPMVMIQVLIAEVGLNNTDEFGVELGLQDSLLFDRSLLSGTQFQTTTTQTQSPGGSVVNLTEQRIISSELTPGFNFNNQALGNNGSTNALARAGNVGAQGLSSFALGRVNSDLNFGGFVFSASSSNVSALLRALQENRRLEVLSRPQIMTLDGQQGVVQVGAKVPRVTNVSLTQFGQTNSFVDVPVGIILRVTPRISPDGQVVMNVYAEKSQVGPEASGIPISVSNAGQVVRTPQIETTQAETTISATSGQTVVLSGLLTKRTSDVHRRVPLLSDIPLLGNLFRYDAVTEQRTELLIILTPRVISSEADAEMLKQVEAARMSWVLSDVIELHGPSGLRTRADEWPDSPEFCPPSLSPEELQSLGQKKFDANSAAEPSGVERRVADPDVSAVGYTAPIGAAETAPPTARPGQQAPRRLPTAAMLGRGGGL